MTGDRAIRHLTTLVVLAVAAFAAIVSYSHIYDLARAHGQAGTAARLLPLSVDGLILAASLVLLHEARNRRRSPVLARAMLWLGVAATVGANGAYGAPYGWLGMLVSTWPAGSFVGAVEMLMHLVRRTRPVPRATTPDRAATVPPKRAPRKRATRATPARPATVPPEASDAYRASVAAGTPLSERAMAGRFGISRRQAANVRAMVTAEANGHAPG